MSKDMIEEFRKQVYDQAVSLGRDPVVAEAIAAQAILDRLEVSESGYAVGQSEDFAVEQVRELRFEMSSFSVDQSEGGGVVAEYILVAPSDDEMGQSFDPLVFPAYAEQINAGEVHGYIDDHGEFRATLNRDGSKSVTEWVRARVEMGRLFITTKLKAGFEWVADKFKAVSIEAVVPVSQTKIVGKKRKYSGGKVKGFAFTNRPKNSDHKQVSVSKK
jgi:hypothetical protein